MQNNKNDTCKYSAEYGVIIHKFDVGSATCKCGSEKAPKIEIKKGGWRGYGGGKSKNKTNKK